MPLKGKIQVIATEQLSRAKSQQQCNTKDEAINAFLITSYSVPDMVFGTREVHISISSWDLALDDLKIFQMVGNETKTLG